jgi:hypothetical protein
VQREILSRTREIHTEKNVSGGIMTTTGWRYNTADCNKPSIHATPSGHPVSFVKTVNTNSASVLGAVARITAEVAIQAVIDQNTTM